MRIGIMPILSLSDACLSEIVCNFGRYCAAFTDSNCRVPKQQGEFLKRCFSETLFARLKHEGTLKPEYIGILINPYLKELDLVGIEKRLLPAIVEKVKIHGRNVLSLKVCVCALEKSLLKCLISSLPNVETIDAEGCDSTASNTKKKGFRLPRNLLPHSKKHALPIICKAIGKSCPHLKVLKLHFWGFSNISLIERFNRGISYILSHCQQLEILEYPDSIGALYAMHKCGLRFTSKKYNDKTKTYSLKNLSSMKRNYSLYDALELCNPVCPYVSRIQIDCLKNEAELQNISRFKHLKDLELGNDSLSITDESLNRFLSLVGSKLIHLNIPYLWGMSVEHLIACCPKLQSLALREVRYHDHRDFLLSSYKAKPESQLPREAKLPHLKAFEFSHADFQIQKATDTLKLILSVSENIEKLDLSGSRAVTVELIRSLNLSNVRELNLSETDIRVEALIEIMLQHKLHVLDVEKCPNITKNDYFNIKECISSDRRVLYI